MVKVHSNPEVILESLPLPIGVIDQDGRILEANTMFSSLPGDVLSSPDFSAFLARAREDGSASATVCTGSDCCTALGKTVQGSDGCQIAVAFVRGGATEKESGCRLAILAGIMKAATSPTSLRETLAAVAEKTIALLDFDAGAIYLLEKDGTSAVRRADAGLYPIYFPDTLPVGTAGDEWPGVFSEGRASYGETYLGVAHAEGELGVYSRAVVPISLPSGAVLGALAIASSSFHSFSPLEKETLEAIGREVGGVIHKTALTDALAAAKAEAEFYLDVMIHDINNANSVAMGYLEMLREDLSGQNRIFADHCMQGIRQSSGIIEEVRIVRTCSGDGPSLIPVSLDRVITTVIEHAPDVGIAYAGTDAVVLADDLLGQVFVNIIGNSVKFGGPDVAIAIAVADGGGEIRVSIADDGPGIPDDRKEKVFERFFRNDPSKPGRGMGLFIATVLVRRYGGEIKATDRVPGRPEEGAAFCFTLKKAAP